MSKSNHTEAQMIGALKQLEAGRKAEDVAREVGVSKHTIYAWKAKYGGMDVSEAQEAKPLREENSRLKKLVVDLSLDKEMLKAGIAKNGWARRTAVGGELAAVGVGSERAPGLRADGDGGIELPLSDDTLRRRVTSAAGGVGAGETAVRVSAIAGAVAARRRTSESQAGASGVSGSGVELAAEETETLRASGKAAAGADGGESGVGTGFRARCDGVRAGDPGAERGGRLHERVLGAGGRHQLRQPESDARAGGNHRRAGPTQFHPLRQRIGVHEPPFSGLGHGEEDRGGAYSTGQADPECAGGELSRTTARRVFEGELVSESVRCQTEDRGVEEGV